jgi:hypothetical protein
MGRLIARRKREERKNWHSVNETANRRTDQAFFEKFHPAQEKYPRREPEPAQRRHCLTDAAALGPVGSRPQALLLNALIVNTFSDGFGLQ